MSRKHQLMQDVYENEQGWMNDKDKKYTNLQSKLCLSWFPAKRSKKQ